MSGNSLELPRRNTKHHWLFVVIGLLIAATILFAISPLHGSDMIPAWLRAAPSAAPAEH